MPRTVYPGSVARLFATWGVLPQGPLAANSRRRLSGYRYQGASLIHKTPVVFWRPGDWFLNCHVTSKPVAARVVPIHALSSSPPTSGARSSTRSRPAATTRASRSYRLYATLIERMRARDGAFVAGVSGATGIRATSPMPGSPDEAFPEPCLDVASMPPL